ncbi:hypothetical protein DICPUDRAFT_88078 [Dictyostelium purpureum]|uniref:Uncharacterized protein n=1 Tax=Dictyostelium purpureum TaxID=5786 RepID=F0ZM85_DICPU|nr:uncharacterized protein DICPUDRAFT_88078 [Dictyostelium purpureum]EGC34940.1 hypothetical protein DICPUDRAFT_88078 [Dictyostelium purpureum]|eukprot:XP_003288521.1 hypothetical protein DICPUDRAFT_88078 [Dictyostelium purpureum]
MEESSPPSVRRLQENFEGPKKTSPTTSPAPTRLNNSAGNVKFDNDTSSISKQKSQQTVEKFLKEEVLPKGHAPGSAHKSAIGKPPPNELDNRAKAVPKFSGNSHPVYGLMLAGKQHETSTTKKKIVIPPSSAY